MRCGGGGAPLGHGPALFPPHSPAMRGRTLADVCARARASTPGSALPVWVPCTVFLWAPVLTPSMVATREDFPPGEFPRKGIRLCWAPALVFPDPFCLMSEPEAGSTREGEGGREEQGTSLGEPLWPGRGDAASRQPAPLLCASDSLSLSRSGCHPVSDAGAIDERSIKRRNVPSAHDCGSGFATGFPWVSPTRPWKDPLVRVGSCPGERCGWSPQPPEPSTGMEGVGQREGETSTPPLGEGLYCGTASLSKAMLGVPLSRAGSRGSSHWEGELWALGRTTLPQPVSTARCFWSTG